MGIVSVSEPLRVLKSAGYPHIDLFNSFPAGRRHPSTVSYVSTRGVSASRFSSSASMDSEYG
jgi:hypothetical protein